MISQVLLGDMGTGKTSLVLRFIKGQFSEYQVAVTVFSYFYCFNFLYTPLYHGSFGLDYLYAYAAGIDNWGSILHSGLVFKWSQREIWYMGHSRARTIPQFGSYVLSWCCCCYSCVWHHKHGNWISCFQVMFIGSILGIIIFILLIND